MPRRLLLLVPLAVSLGLLGPGDAAACGPATREAVVRRAATLMPSGLSRQLKKHIDELVAGALEGVDPAAPVAALDPGDADARLAAALDEAKALLDGRAPFAAVARALGKAARAATDLSYALHDGPPDPRAAGVAPDFCRYVDRKLPKIVFTFPGYADENLAEGDVAGFARRVARDARRDYAAVLASYFPPGRARTAADFDERSVAFGAASLESSLALTSVARAWLFAWHRAGGDLYGTPFLNYDPEGAAASPDGTTPPQEKRP